MTQVDWTPFAEFPDVAWPVAQATNGQVLVLGGRTDDGISASSYLIDVEQRKVLQAADLVEPRLGHAAVPLPDGSALIIGGSARQEIFDRNLKPHTFEGKCPAEVWNPNRRYSTALWSLPIPCLNRCSVTLVPPNMALIVGGDLGDGEASALAFLISLGTFEILQQTKLSAPRFAHAGIFVPGQDGVLIAGGVGSGGESPAFSEFWRRSSGQWIAPQPMSTWRHETQLLSTTGQTVVAVGGRKLEPLDSVELWQDGCWSHASPMGFAMAGFTATQIYPGRFVLVGGNIGDDESASPAAQIFDARTREWQVVDGPRSARYGHCAVSTEAGQLLVVGGLDCHIAELGRAK